MDSTPSRWNDSVRGLHLVQGIPILGSKLLIMREPALAALSYTVDRPPYRMSNQSNYVNTPIGNGYQILHDITVYSVKQRMVIIRINIIYINIKSL